MNGGGDCASSNLIIEETRANLPHSMAQDWNRGNTKPQRRRPVPRRSRMIPIVTILAFALPMSRCGTASLSFSATIV